MTPSNQAYIEQLREAVKNYTFPPLSMVRLIFIKAKKAKQDELHTMEQKLEQHRQAAEQAVIEMFVRHQVHLDNSSELGKTIKRVRHDHE